MKFTSSILVASLATIISASPKRGSDDPTSSKTITPAIKSGNSTSTSAVGTITILPEPLFDPVVLNHEVKAVQAIAALTPQQNNDLRNLTRDPNWIQLTYNNGPYVEVFLNKLTYLKGDATSNSYISIWSINIAAGNGNYDETQVFECKGYLDDFGTAPYGQAFGASDNSYLIGGGRLDSNGQRVAGPGIPWKTVLCYGKGALFSSAVTPLNSTIPSNFTNASSQPPISNSTVA